MPETHETPAAPAETAAPEAPAPLPDRHEVGPHGEQPEAPAEVVQRKPRLVEPRVGQRARILVPERTTASGKPIPVMRPGTPARPYQTDDIVRWDNHLVHLRQEGAVLAVEIVE